jgi:hypothetical protein
LPFYADRRPDVEPVEFATKVVAAIIADQYGDYRVVFRAITSAQPWAPAYVSDLKVLLPRLLDESPGSNSERSNYLQRALQELESRSATSLGWRFSLLHIPGMPWRASV